MARRSKTASKDKVVKLTAEEIKIAAARMMAGAQAHQRASGWCMDKPDAKPPNIDAFFFDVVSFELVLLSVEQSLRLLLLLHYSIVRDDTNHNPHVLYRTMQNKSGGKIGIRQDIISKMNELGQTKGIAPFSEKELVGCLRKHDSSYSNFRYFQLDHQARLNKKWEYSGRDVQIIHCLALALIHLNMDEMGKRGIGAMLSMSQVPESEMTEELKDLKERLMSRSI
jgi:hypothetical protein